MAFMRHNNNGRRHNNNRHRHNNNGQQQGQRRHVNRINQVFESNGPEGRVRGTAQQIVEKYLTMARDAQGAGDKVLSMNYFQHAEHYQRVLNDIQEENAVFERDREAQRAAQQAAQPDVAEQVDGQNDADNQDGQQSQASGDEQGEQNNARRQPRGNSSRTPAQQQRAPRRKADSDDDLNSLPGFLQVPITESAPPAENAAPSAAKNTVKSDKKNDEVVVEKTRTVRTRRVAAAAKEEAAE